MRTAPLFVAKTWFDELDKVERHLNQRKHLSVWLSIRVYEPERQENGEILWHIRKNPSDTLKKMLTIGLYVDHTFLIKDIKKQAKIYACADSKRVSQKSVISNDTKKCSQ